MIRIDYKNAVDVSSIQIQYYDGHGTLVKVRWEKRS
jgi:hypothetical protein